MPWPTIPTDGSAAIVCATRVSLLGAHQSSPSRNATISPLHSGIPALNAEACPPFSLRNSRTRASNFFTISRVPSVEPSSTTMISRSESGKSCSSTLTIACSMKRSWLYVSISTLAKLFAKLQLPRNPQSYFRAMFVSAFRRQCFFFFRRHALLRGRSEQPPALHPDVIQNMQMMIAQEQRRERTQIAVSPVPRRHDLAVRPRKIKQVAEVFPPARRSQGKSIALLGFCPLLQVSANVRRVRFLAMFFQPVLYLTEKRLPHGHSALDLAARDSLCVRLKQIRSMQPVFPQEFRHRRNRRDKNNQRSEIGIGLKSQRLRYRQQFLERFASERQAGRAHHRILQQRAPALRYAPRNRNEISVLGNVVRAIPQMHAVVNHPGGWMPFECFIDSP